MRILLGSGGFRTDARKALLREEMQRQFGAARRILFIPYALADHDGYLAAMKNTGLDGGYELAGIHREPDPVGAVRAAEGIYVGGGNTFRLLDELHRQSLLGPIHERVSAGAPYMGVSAGTNVACPTLMTTNDMPIVQPPSFRALDLVPFQVNAHYYAGRVQVAEDGDFVEHFGETRDERIAEFHELNETPVIGLREGGFMRIDGAHLWLVGSSARLFRRGQLAEDFSPAALPCDDLEALWRVSS